MSFKMKGWDGYVKPPSFKKTASPFTMQSPGGSERFWDRVQTGLSFAGTVFPQADVANALISGGRAAVSKIKGDDDAYKKHKKAAGINALAVIPGVGEATKAIKAGKAIKTTKPTKQITDAVESIKSKGVTDKVSTLANLEYWRGTAEQIKKDITGGYEEEAIDKVNKELAKEGNFEETEKEKSKT
tara:strand:+ start:62 stop:619 length:558 start_codon:yes stop_codon:yes gene_type:complete